MGVTAMDIHHGCIYIKVRLHFSFSVASCTTKGVFFCKIMHNIYEIFVGCMFSHIHIVTFVTFNIDHVTVRCSYILAMILVSLVGESS